MKIRIRSKHNGSLMVFDELGRPIDGVTEIRMTAKPGQQPVVSIDVTAPEVVFDADVEDPAPADPGRDDAEETSDSAKEESRGKKAKK